MSQHDRDDHPFEGAQRALDVFAKQKFMHLIGTQVRRCSAGFVELAIPSRPDLLNQHGTFHGGLVGTLVDNCAGMATGTLAPKETGVLTIEYKMNFLAPATGDVLIGRGTVLKAGRMITVAKTEVFSVKDGQEKLVAVALVSCTNVPLLSGVQAGSSSSGNVTHQTSVREVHSKL